MTNLSTVITNSVNAAAAANDPASASQAAPAAATASAGGATADPPAAALAALDHDTVQVDGVIKVVDAPTATLRKWALGRPGRGRDGVYVLCRPGHNNKRSYLRVAKLPVEFKAQSIAHGLLQEAVPADSIDGTNLIFPILDRILARAEGGPIQFVTDAAAEEWMTNPVALGPSATKLHAHFTACEQEGKWTGISSTQKAVHMLDALLTVASGSPASMHKTLWLGCPVTTEQMLACIQIRLGSASTGWAPPPIDDSVKIIAEVDALGTRARDIVENLCSTRSINVEKATQLLQDVEAAKVAVVSFSQTGWMATCELAAWPEIHNLLDTIAKRTASASADDTRPTAVSASLPPTVIVQARPKEGQSRLTPLEQAELARALKLGGSKSINISHAKLLLDATGTEIGAMQLGSSDLSPLGTCHEFKSFIISAQAALCSETSAHRFPAAALAKVASLRISSSDAWALEQFGHVIWRDNSPSPRTRKKVATPHGDLFYLSGKRDLWAAIESLQDLANAAHGLAAAVDYLLHPSIIAAGDVRDIFETVHNLYLKYDGQAPIDVLRNAFQARIEEHAEAVRSVVDGNSTVVPPTTQWGTRSKIYLKWAEERANAVQVASLGPDGRNGFTGVAHHRIGRNAMDADGKQSPYPHEKAPSSARNLPPTGSYSAQASQPQRSATTAAPDSTPTKRAPSGGADHSQPKKKRAAEDTICVKCGKKGHVVRNCSADGFCAVCTAWPEALIARAVSVRQYHGEQITWDGAPPPAPQKSENRRSD